MLSCIDPNWVDGGLPCVQVGCFWFWLLRFSAGTQRVTTSQYNNARTGANVHESRLTPRNVNARQFGKLFALPVDGDAYAQPLFLGGVEIPGKAGTMCCLSQPSMIACMRSMLTATRAARFGR